jgi:hypothetical protein
VLDGGDGELGVGLGLEVELVELLAGVRDEAGGELLAARGPELGRDGPVFLRAERLDLHLALHDQAEADGLDAACGLGAGELAPQDGGKVEAHEVVEGAAGEIRLHERRVHLAGVAHGLGHGGLGDGVEGDAGDLGVLADRLAVAQRLGEVPGDRLALAVGVGGEDEVGVVLERVGDGLEVLTGLGRDLPFHGEALVRVH